MKASGNATARATAAIAGATPQPRQRQCAEEHHGALREVEDAGSLEDQHEAESDQRIQHARHQPAQNDFEKEPHVRACLPVAALSD
jgi:hypothetical protein